MTDCTDLRAAVIAALNRGWSCTALSDGRVLVAAPFTFHDGDHPEMIVTLGEGGVGQVSDFGSTAARLGLRDVALKPDRIRRPASSIAKGYGLALTEDDELVRDGMTKDLGEVVVSMASAMLQIDTLAFTTPIKGQPRFDTTVGRWLQRSLTDLRVEPGHRVLGRHGKRHRVTAVVQTPNRATYVQAVGRASAEARPIEHTFRVFYEVNGQVTPREKVVVLQGPVADYDEPDIDLLREVAQVGTWDHRDRVLDYLRNPAPAEGNRLYEVAAPPLT